MEGLEELNIREMKINVIKAGKVAVEELIKVAEKPLLGGLNITSSGVDSDEDEITADKLTRATQAKKMAIMDAFEILTKIEIEHNLIEASLNPEQTVPKNFTSDRAKSNK